MAPLLLAGSGALLAAVELSPDVKVHPERDVALLRFVDSEAGLGALAAVSEMT